ncbi:MAG: hypothetical protein ABIZ81_13465 [Opitutaceae bacterium]
MKPLLGLAFAFAAVLVGLRAAEPATAGSGLGVTLLLSTQYAHTDIFYHTPSEFPPAFTRADEIAPGQRLDVVVIARGYAVDAESQANVSYELTIHKPDGTTLRLPNRVTISEKKRVDPRHLLFPLNVASFSTNPGDPAGEYRFEIAVRDEVNRATVSDSARVRVSDSADPLPLPADTDVLRFLSDYYLRPRPRLALAALTAFSQSPYAQRKADGHGTLLGFYDRVLIDNPWLLPQFLTRILATKDESERRILALVLVYAKRNEPNFGSDLPRAVKNALAAARKETLPLPSREPTVVGQLDLQWGAFLASGRFTPITELVAVVENYLPYRGKLEEFKKLAAKPKAMPLEPMKDVLLSSALWSLGSNAYQQKLVRYYLIGIERAPETTPAVKSALREALAWQPKENPSAPAAK